jgi:hypothetical protein
MEKKDGRGIRKCILRENSHNFFFFLKNVNPEYVCKQKRRNSWRRRGKRSIR